MRITTIDNKYSMSSEIGKDIIRKEPRPPSDRTKTEEELKLRAEKEGLKRELEKDPSNYELGLDLEIIEKKLLILERERDGVTECLMPERFGPNEAEFIKNQNLKFENPTHLEGRVKNKSLPKMILF